MDQSVQLLYSLCSLNPSIFPESYFDNNGEPTDGLNSPAGIPICIWALTTKSSGYS